MSGSNKSCAEDKLKRASRVVVVKRENPAWEVVRVREGLQGDWEVVTFKLSSNSVLLTLSHGYHPLNSESDSGGLSGIWGKGLLRTFL